jgi:hypothetical protein
MQVDVVWIVVCHKNEGVVKTNLEGEDVVGCWVIHFLFSVV